MSSDSNKQNSPSIKDDKPSLTNEISNNINKPEEKKSLTTEKKESLSINNKIIPSVSNITTINNTTPSKIIPENTNDTSNVTIATNTISIKLVNTNDESKKATITLSKEEEKKGDSNIKAPEKNENNIDIKIDNKTETQTLSEITQNTTITDNNSETKKLSEVTKTTVSGNKLETKSINTTTITDNPTLAKISIQINSDTIVKQEKTKAVDESFNKIEDSKKQEIIESNITTTSTTTLNTNSEKQLNSESSKINTPIVYNTIKPDSISKPTLSSNASDNPINVENKTDNNAIKKDILNIQKFTSNNDTKIENNENTKMEIFEKKEENNKETSNNNDNNNNNINNSDKEEKNEKDTKGDKMDIDKEEPGLKPEIKDKSNINTSNNMTNEDNGVKPMEIDLDKTKEKEKEEKENNSLPEIEKKEEKTDIKQEDKTESHKENTSENANIESKENEIVMEQKKIIAEKKEIVSDPTDLTKNEVPSKLVKTTNVSTEIKPILLPSTTDNKIVENINDNDVVNPKAEDTSISESLKHEEEKIENKIEVDKDKIQEIKPEKENNESTVLDVNDKTLKKEEKIIANEKEEISKNNDDKIKKTVKTTSRDDTSNTLMETDESASVSSSIIPYLTEPEQESMDDDKNDSDNQRKQALEEMKNIEIDFAKLREKIYQEKMDELDNEIEMIKNDQHPDLVELIKKLEAKKDERISMANAWKHYQLQCIENQFRIYYKELDTTRQSKVNLTRKELINEVQSKRWKIYKDKRKIEINNLASSSGNELSNRYKKRRISKSEVGLLKSMRMTGFAKNELREDLDILKIRYKN